MNPDRQGNCSRLDEAMRDGELLVDRVSPFAPACDGGKDFARLGGPNERLWIGRGGKLADGGLPRGDGAEHAAPPGLAKEPPAVSRIAEVRVKGKV